jgi:cell division protease FtsH
MPVETKDKSKLPSPKALGNGLLALGVLLLVLNFVILPFFRPRPTFFKVSYSEFLKKVKSTQVDEALVAKEQIIFNLKPGGQPCPIQPPNTPIKEQKLCVTTPVADDPNLTELLAEHDVKFDGLIPNQSDWFATLLGWVVPPLIFVAIWIWFMKNEQGGSSALTVGKSKARIYSEGNTGVNFTNVAGVEEAKAELKEIVEFLKNSDKYTKIGAAIPKGVLLSGPPGTGKTLLARAVAGEAGVPFFSISGAEFIELFVGVGAARVRDLFEQAKRQAPCIVFIDELDALGKARRSGGFASGSSDEQEQTLNQLLTEMDGFEANTGVIILAATNRPEILDSALRRPGRFDRQVVVDRPDKLGREAILRVHAKKVQLGEDVDLGLIATRTPGFAGADLANLINEAALLAARQNSTVVRMADLNEAIERVIGGLEKKSRVLNATEKKTVAYHEVGHALVGALMPGAGKVEKISIVPRGVGALGYTLQLPEEDRFLMIEPEIRGRIATLLGGRSAEEIVFQQVSTGASDDLQKVTDLAERMITVYGMNRQLGPVAFERLQQGFLEGWQSSRRSISLQVAEKIDRAVQETVENAHQIALEILKTNRDLLEEIAQVLLAQEVLEGTQLYQYLEQVQAPNHLETWLRTGELSSQELTS